MWLLWIALLIFTAELTFSDATVYGSVNDSPEDTDQPSASGSSSGLGLLSQPSPLDFVDTRGRFGSRENSDESSKETDLFSQIKHLQLPAKAHHPYTSGHEFKPASDSEMANVRNSLATVLQVLLPYGRLQQRPGSHGHADDHPPPFGDDPGDFSSGNPLLPDGPETANYMLHGKLVEIGPRRYGAARSLLADTAGDAPLGAVGQKRAAALRSTVARRSHALPAGAGSGNGEDGSFLPSISVGEFYGALTNLGDFFQNLKHNLESLESKHLNTEQVKLLEGQNMISHLRKGFFYSRVCRGLSKAGGQCRLPARHPELSAFASNSGAGVHRAGAVPWHQLSRSRVYACRTRKMSYPPTIRPPHSVLLASC
ncbi:uncharacterized protein LOC131281995 [Anopheles ziemanni]|uniref:uncharacterized protein LOC131265894 n=1 Tax=Anopheles coustani TaxID=139045 RepID=UPI002659A646|nr:uncharacterized protein LOC131265894 [Anopheles coustani]XP_058167359.1 uncharacterized protein LOC131281995 [Anopheles ziemanni]